MGLDQDFENIYQRKVELPCKKNSLEDNRGHADLPAWPLKVNFLPYGVLKEICIEKCAPRHSQPHVCCSAAGPNPKAVEGSRFPQYAVDGVSSNLWSHWLILIIIDYSFLSACIYYNIKPAAWMEWNELE